MNNFDVHQIFGPEEFTDSLTNLSEFAREFYGEWILNLRSGKTFFLVNVNWNGYNWKIPHDYDRYVFSFHVEPWQHDWIKHFCESHPNQEVVLISEYPINHRYYNLPNLKILVYHCWAWLMTKVLQYDTNFYVPAAKRTHHLSSLVNKPSFFKALTTTYIFRKNYRDKAIVSWNINKRKELCPSLQYLDTAFDYSDEIKELIVYYHQHLKQVSINLDDFNDTRFSNYFCQIPAYTQCLVNITNETYQTTEESDYIMTGPYLTEKTWKPLLTGSALLPQGMPNTYSYLSQFGFRFVYPWNIEFDQLVPDFPRYLQVLKIIDQIYHSDFLCLAESIEESNLYNFEHIRSQNFIDNINTVNQSSLENFLSA